RAITFFLHAIQHGEPDFRQFLGNLARGGSRKRALENRASELLQKLSDFHKICNSAAASTTSLAMGADTAPPYPPCSTSTANAIRRAPSAGANPANHACGMPVSICAVPVFPAIAMGEPAIARRAVPSVTTLRMA